MDRFMEDKVASFEGTSNSLEYPSESRNEENPPIEDQVCIKPKKIEKLEEKLTNFLIDRFDSKYRKRYIKRWIYGEEITSQK